MTTGLLILQFILVPCLILLVFLQYGKGSRLGASFGAGASQTMLESAPPLDLFGKLTGVIAILFLANSVLLTLSFKHDRAQSTLLDQISNLNTQSTPDLSKGKITEPASPSTDSSKTTRKPNTEDLPN